jgi:tetratricopeptide (TPR) repeat protein
MKDSFSDPDPLEEASAYEPLDRNSMFQADSAPDYRGVAPFDLVEVQAPVSQEAAEAGWPSEVREAHVHPKNRFAHFVLVEQVGCGLSGTVYRAWDTRWQQYSAVKILHSMESGVLEKFILEAPRAAHLRHPGIATSYEAGEHEGQWYVAMTYIEGRPIDADTRSVSFNLEMMRDACRALEHAHDQGILHGDIKSSNILVDRLDRVHLTDFGVPHRRFQSDIRGDVYDFGVALYKLLAGKRAATGRPLTKLNSEVSPELEAVVSRAMSKDPARRHASAGELADDLDRVLLDRSPAGTYGVTLQLVKKWGPVAMVGVALALIFAWLAPAFLGSALAAGETDTKEGHYKRAAIALLRIEESDDLADPARRAPRIREYVYSHLAGLNERMPTFLHAKVLGVRAHLVGGDVNRASRELASLAEYEPLDYRVRFFRTLIELEDALAKPLPLPAPEAPGPVWAGELPGWLRFHDDLIEVMRVPVEVDSPLYAEYRRDAEAARALLPLVEGQWRLACEKLTTLTQSQRLPVYLAARRAASYLARRFDEVLNEPGTQFALALDSSDVPAEDLKRLRPLFAGCPRREATLFCWSARRSAARGSDPGSLVKEGLALDSLENEARGILQIADLRGRQLTGRDAEAAYLEARELLGGQPVTWMGRIAAIEALLGTGRSLQLRDGHFRTVFAQAIEESNSLPSEEGWNVPYLLRAEALLGLGQYQEAKAEAGRVQGPTTDEVRALLISAAASLRQAEKAQETRSPKAAEYLAEAMTFSDRAVARIKDHPMALTLRAAAALQAAELSPESALLPNEAIRRLSIALDRAPEFVEARFHRAAAYFLLAERTSRTDSKGEEYRTAAIADLDRILQTVPDLAAAYALRGLVRASLGQHAGSIDDFKEALKRSPCGEPDEVRMWMRAAEFADKNK